jgi:hypothetical protein
MGVGVQDFKAGSGDSDGGEPTDESGSDSDDEGGGGSDDGEGKPSKVRAHT